MSVREPKPATLKRYGLSLAEWQALLEEQDGACRVCRKTPSSGRLVVDHEHVKGWKAMPPERRKRYVRGLLCFFCNKYYVGRSITIAKSENVTLYLKDHELRKMGVI